MTVPPPSGSAAPRSRPLSPHLQVWKWTLTMATSILHRATGIALTVGLVGLVWGFVAAAAGPEAYARFMMCVRSELGQLMLFGWLLAMYLHLATGIRHLVMDTGAWLSIKGTDRAITILITIALVLTAATWAFLKGWI